MISSCFQCSICWTLLCNQPYRCGFGADVRTVCGWLRLMTYNFVHLIRKIFLPHSCLCRGEKLLGETLEDEKLIQLYYRRDVKVSPYLWQLQRGSVSADSLSFSSHTQHSDSPGILLVFFLRNRNRFWRESPGNAQIWLLSIQPNKHCAGL